MTVKLNGHCIPEDRWYDLVANVMAWWLREAQQFVSGEQRLIFPFMDGPYELRFADKGDGLYSVSFVQRGKDKDTLLAEGEALATHIVAELLRESERLLEHCDNIGLVASDLEDLSDAHSQLKRFTA